MPDTVNRYTLEELEVLGRVTSHDPVTLSLAVFDKLLATAQHGAVTPEAGARETDTAILTEAADWIENLEGDEPGTVASRREMVAAIRRATPEAGAERRVVSVMPDGLIVVHDDATEEEITRAFMRVAQFMNGDVEGLRKSAAGIKTTGLPQGSTEKA